MPQPSINQVHVDAILTNASVAYIQSADNFIANKVFPIVPVDKQSNLYFKYTKEDWFRDDAQVRADGTEAATSGYGLTTDSYYAYVYAIKKAVGDQTMANFDNPLDPLRDASKFTAQLILNRMENQFVTDFIGGKVWGKDFFGTPNTPAATVVVPVQTVGTYDSTTGLQSFTTTGNHGFGVGQSITVATVVTASGTLTGTWTTQVGTTGSTIVIKPGSAFGNVSTAGTVVSADTQFKIWSDLTNSDPIQDVETWKATILSTTGFEANKLVLGYDVYQVLRNHPDVIDRVKYTGNQVPDTQYLAQLFGLNEVLVAKAVKNTANEGATGSFSFTFGKSALLVYSAPSPSILTPSAGYCFQWTGVSEGLGMTVGTKQYRLEQNASTYVESQVAFANKIVAKDLGVFAGNVVA